MSIADPTMSFGIGDLSPSAEAVDVRGHRAYLNLTPFAGQLGWRLGDGTAVYLTSARVSGDELVEVGRAIDVAPDRTLVVPSGSLPVGLALERSTAPGEWDARLGAEVSYARPDARLALRLQTGGEWLLDNLVRDRLASAETARTVTVHGVRGVLSTYQGTNGGHSVMWTVRPGVVAEVRADGISAEDALAAAQSVKEIDQAEWDSLVARFGQTPASPPESRGSGPDRHAEVGAILCDLRATWLAEPTRRAGALTGVRQLRATAVAERLDRDSDILVVLDDMIGAMTDGDEQAVRSIPGGGC